ERLMERGLFLLGEAHRAQIRACTGSAVCALGVTTAPDAGASLLESASLGRNSALRVHVSGCPNSCAQHQIGDIGLSGAKVKLGGKVRHGYQVFLGADLGAGCFADVVGRGAGSATAGTAAAPAGPAASAAAPVAVAALADLAPESARTVEVNGCRIALVHTGGRVCAVADRCPHSNASLGEGAVVEEFAIECPLHGAVFDLRTGEPLEGPTDDPVPTYD